MRRSIIIIAKIIRITKQKHKTNNDSEKKTNNQKNKHNNKTLTNEDNTNKHNKQIRIVISNN